MVDISTVIDITTEIAAGGAPTRTFGRGLLVTESDRLSAGGDDKLRLFDTLAEAADFFASGSDTLADAAVWFGANPQPQGLYIGRWARTDVATALTGGTPGDQTSITVNNASFDLNGTTVTADLSGDSTYTEAAAGIQTAVQAAGGVFSGAMFAYVNNVFVLTLTGGGVIEGGALGTPDSGTDISGLLGMAATSTGRRYIQGKDAESVQDAIAEMIRRSPTGPPVGVALGSDAGLTDPQAANADTRLQAAAYIQGTDLMFAFVDTADQAVAAGDTTSALAQANVANYSRTAGFYSVGGQRPDIGLLALLSTQDLDRSASFLSPFGKPLPGVQPTDVTEAQIERLEAKNASVYTRINGIAGVYGGATFRDGHYADSVWWLSWLDRQLSETVWATHRASRRFTRALLGDALRRVMQNGVRNGGIEPGREVPAATRGDIITTTGNAAFDGKLTTGYLVYLPAPTAEDRSNRHSRFQIWLASAEAVHTVSGNVKLVA